jgi:hypothetical protein
MRHTAAQQILMNIMLIICLVLGYRPAGQCAGAKEGSCVRRPSYKLKLLFFNKFQAF